jgi:hypothetical protein
MWQINTMGWFFTLKLSEPTLEGVVHRQEKAFETPPNIMGNELLAYTDQYSHAHQCSKIWNKQ